MRGPRAVLFMCLAARGSEVRGSVGVKYIAVREGGKGDTHENPVLTNTLKINVLAGVPQSD